MPKGKNPYVSAYAVETFFVYEGGGHIKKIAGGCDFFCVAGGVSLRGMRGGR